MGVSLPKCELITLPVEKQVLKERERPSVLQVGNSVKGRPIFR